MVWASKPKPIIKVLALRKEAIHGYFFIANGSMEGKISVCKGSHHVIFYPSEDKWVMDDILKMDQSLFHHILLLLPRAIFSTQKHTVWAVKIWDIIFTCFQMMVIYKAQLDLVPTGVLALPIMEQEIRQMKLWVRKRKACLCGLLMYQKNISLWQQWTSINNSHR